MTVLAKALLLAVYPLLLLAWAVNRLCGFDRLHLRSSPSDSGWIRRAARPDLPSYFSQASLAEGGHEKSAGRTVTALLIAASRLFRPRKADAGAPYKSAAAREEGIPDEVYTLW